MRLSPSLMRATRTWLRISPAVMLRMNPIVPVLQNVQPIAQPICEETHWAIRTEPSCPVLGRMTVSTSAPSRSRSSSFSVPSDESVPSRSQEARSPRLPRAWREAAWKRRSWRRTRWRAFAISTATTCRMRPDLAGPSIFHDERSSSGNVRFRMSIMRAALLCGYR